MKCPTVLATYTNGPDSQEYLAIFEKTFQENKVAVARLLEQIKAKLVEKNP